MPCYRPLTGYESIEVNESGKRSIVFTHRDGYTDKMITVPCGACIGCRLDRAQKWALRCLHESSLYEDNCFITLTYDDDKIPENYSLEVKDFQKFMKRLRKAYPEKTIRFFHCGEYGEQTHRPHYHACIFNFDFPDKKILPRDARKEPIYSSEILSSLWGKGHCSVGALTYNSASYVARYILKKVTGQQAKNHYNGRKPEYITMSRRPGIGHEWIKENYKDIYPDDFVVLRGGQKFKAPKYYDTVYDEIDHKSLMLIKGRREKQAKNNPDQKNHRLYAREKVKIAQIQSLKREL